MLRILDNYNPTIAYDFRLNKVEYNDGWLYTLNSASHPGFNLDFKLPYKIDTFHDGYSVTIYLLKNKQYAQKDVIEVRVNEITKDNGRIGYIAQLSSIFDPSILNVNKHLFSYIYYALGNIFYNNDYKQTKSPDFSKTTFGINDFFDDDTLFLMICDQVIAQIPNFNINSYIASLYERGFYFVTTNENSFWNNTQRMIDNYGDLSNNKNSQGYYSIRLKSISLILLGEDFFIKLFKRQLLKKNDQETRFLNLYQVVEILISKILTIELKKNICSSTRNLEAFKLKSEIDETVKESFRINKLFNDYSTIDHGLTNELQNEIYDLLQYLGFPDYVAEYNPSGLSFNTIFYDYRNKLLHSHRSFIANHINENIVNNKMSNINYLIELMIVQILVSYTG